MSTYFRIEQQAISIPQDTKLVRSREYRDLQRADGIIKKTREREQEILMLSKQIYEQEKQRGYEDGMREAKQERAQALQVLTARYSTYTQELEGALYDMVLSIVEKLMGDVPRQELIIGMIKKTLDRYTKKTAIQLRVHPDLVKKIESTIKTMIFNHPFLEHIEIIGDLKLAEDICILETKYEVIELNLQDQLQTIMGIMQQLKSNS